VSVQRFTLEGLAPPPGYAHGAAAAGLVFTAGAVPLDEAGRLVGEGDVAAQTAQVVANLEAALAAGGATADDVLKTTVYVASTDRDDLVTAWEAFQRSPIHHAPSTLLGVTVLGYPGQLVEIEAVAVLSG
jgi:enamine deaminase RidA (YjgF/YER057c/UK114 family)